MRHTLGCLLIISLAFLSAQEASAGAPPVGKARLDSFGDPLPEGVFYRLGTVRLRHQHTKTLIFSADGSQLLSQGGTSELRVWDRVTGRILQQLPGVGQCSHLIRSPDDRYLAGVANYHNAVLVDKASGKELARWHHPTGWLALAFSRDGKELVGLIPQQAVVRWNIADRKEIARTKLDLTKVDVGNFGDYWHLSPDGRTVAFLPPATKGEASLPWRFWDTTTGKQCGQPIKTKAWTGEVCWSPDGQRLAVVTRDNTFEIWDAVAGKRLALETAGPPKKGTATSWSQLSGSGVAFHPSGKLLAVSNQGKVATWDANGGKKLWTKKLTAEVLAFSPDGKTLAAGGWGEISLMDAATGEWVGFSRQDSAWINLAGWHNSESWHSSPSFFRHGRSFLVYDQVGLSELETATGKRLRTFSPAKSDWFHYEGLCGGGRLIACVGSERGAAQVFMFEAATGKELWRLPDRPSEIHFDADGKTLAVLSWEGDAFTLVDAQTGRDIKRLPAPSYKYDANTYKTVSDDLRWAATMQPSRPVDLWDIATNAKIRSLEYPPGWGHGLLAFAPGSKLLIGSPRWYLIDRQKQGEWTRVWDIGSGRVRHRFPEPLLKMSADGRWLALQGHKGLVVRHLQTGRLMTTLSGVFSSYPGFEPLGFSPDGSLLAVRKHPYHEVGLWDTHTGRLVRRYVDSLCEFDGVAFAPDGRTLALTVRTRGCLLVCDVTGKATAPGKVPSQDLTPAEADQHWMDLTSDDGPRSHRAHWRLAARGEQTVKLLQCRLRPVEPPNDKNLAALIASLDSANFQERQKSARALEQMPLARPALEEALKRNPPLEMERRIELILAKQDASPPDAELLRAMRGVLLLEQIGTPPARELLQTLAGGAAGSLLTQEAQAALQRLALAGGLR